MENEISALLESGNEEFTALYNEHKVLKAKLTEMNNKMHLTPEEETEKKNLQKVKLAKKDRMAEIIRHYKENRA